MEYTINKVARISGVSTRTLRYYDELGLLKPARINSSNYRIYGEKEIDKLQLILFYKELEIPLLDIKEIIEGKNFNDIDALIDHKRNLELKLKRYHKLINTLDETIKSRKENTTMKETDKFEGFKDDLISKNDKTYGDEVREKFGRESLEYSNKKIKNMSKDEYERVDNLRKKVDSTIKAAFELGDPSSELSIKACELHKEWIMVYWKEYSKEAHLGLAKMYVDDERFTAYYVNNVGVGAAEFFLKAMQHYITK